ncbi:hypothetical protein K6119_00625 [Paracrocinitomix mangrovi]|uniref:hypothetical protein n=1 Tax=Paracrocinitomix mangrovi TaxID=2862509 RepID=UPI001C8DA0E0|nr:hypothetical protein [Paracrocinitomix mangrovi]UKN02019.1 hypothetical protein K6119_00625 [Paracrocinitomix mangrovi]
MSLKEGQSFTLATYSFRGLKRRQETKIRKVIELYSGKPMTNSLEYFQSEFEAACYLWHRKFGKVLKFNYLGKIELIKDTTQTDTYFMFLHYVEATEKFKKKG